MAGTFIIPLQFTMNQNNLTTVSLIDSSPYIFYRRFPAFWEKMLMCWHAPGINELWFVSLNIGKANLGANFQNSFPVILIPRFPRVQFQNIC